MPSYLGIILGLMSIGTGIYLVAGTKENDPYIKSKKGVGIFLIILGTILFMIGALYEETYDPTNPAFLQAQAPLESALENNTTQGNGPVNQVVNTSGPVTVVAPNGSTHVGTPVPVVPPTVNNNAAAAKKAANNAAAAAAQKAANNAAAAAQKAANNAAAAAAAANAGQPAVQSAVVGPAAAAAVPRRKLLGFI